MNAEPERAGLGKVIYSVDTVRDEDVASEEKVDNVEVTEAIEESFPASDPPGFAGSSSTDSV